MEWIQEVDTKILMGLREFFCSAWLDGPMMFISRLGNHGLIWIVLAVCLLLVGMVDKKKKSYRVCGIMVGLSLLFNLLLCNIWLKPLVARSRPYDLLEYEILLPALSDYSFPSGHTSASFAAATAVYAMNKKWGTIAFVFAGLMGFSRLYLGVHFPSDVFFGAFLGCFAAKIAIFMVQKIILSKKSNI